MARQSLISSLLVLLVTMQSSLIAVRADYTFAVEVSRYENPSSTKRNGDWCDSGVLRRSWRRCDNYFIFCLREQETSSLDSSYCPLGRYITTIVTYNKDSYEFDRGKYALNGLPNPLEFGALAGELWNGIQLLVEIRDYDGEDRSADLVDTIAVNFTGPAGPNFTDFETFFGRYEKGQIDLSFQVQCTNDSYGSDCGILCVERDDDQGHYTCDSEGNRVCRDGYQNPETNCTQCVPAEGCSPLGGYCTDPGTCICHEGFLGANCSESSDHELDIAIGPVSERHQGISGAAIAGGVVGASLFMAAVVSAAIVSILLWRYRNSHSTGKGGASALPGDNPVYQVEKAATSAVAIPVDNPTYGMVGDSTCTVGLTGQPGTQPGEDSPDTTLKKFENPIYGTQWDIATNGHIYATLEPQQHVHLPSDVDYDIVPDELPPMQQIYDTPPE